MKRALIILPIIGLIAAGLAWAGSANGRTLSNGWALFAVCVAVAFAIQWVVFVPSFAFKTEAFFDLTGSLTYLTMLVMVILLTPALSPRGWLLCALIGIWAVRLGTFLFRRVRAAGHDSRFTEIKKSFWRYFVVWNIQGLWVTFTLAAALAALTASQQPKLGIFAVIGALCWAIGFGIEVVSDAQKTQFRAVAANKGKFISTGLWAYSRHPNYFGEMLLWIGIAIIALPVLSGAQYITLLSPVFVVLLISRVSGIPMLENAADERWGGQADYEAYKAQTPVLVPMPKRG